MTPFYGENPELGSATAGLNQYFIDSNGQTALPFSWNAHIVLFEWGPTLPAPNPADWIPYWKIGIGLVKITQLVIGEQRLMIPQTLLEILGESMIF